MQQDDSKNKLTPWASAGQELERVLPEVKTLARPVKGPLLAARHEVKRSPKLQALFRAARKERWPAAKLAEDVAPVLENLLEGSPAELREVATYLADEYEQVGDAVLIVSTVTGKAIARITDEDIWQPDPVPRHSGNLVKPLPRLRPDLEGFLVQWVFDEDREQNLLATLSKKGAQTSLTREEGDRRLLPVTRAGRASLAQELGDALPNILGAVQGASRAFLGHFSVLSEHPVETKLSPLVKCTAFGRVVTPIADLSTFNLRYDRLGAMAAQIGTSWVREIARTLAMGTATKERVRVTWPFNTPGFWIGGPDLVQAFGVHRALVVDGAPSTIVRPPAGVIVIEPSSYACQGREVFDRWEVAAAVEYTLYVNWENVVTFDIEGLPEVAVAELVR